MNLNPVEWARAQELLLKLVQVLGPFAAKEPNPQTMAFSLTRNFFVPPSGEFPRFRYAARLLTTLAEAKMEVDDWIGKLPENQPEPGSELSPKPDPKNEVATIVKDLAPKKENESPKTEKEGASPSKEMPPSSKPNASMAANFSFKTKKGENFPSDKTLGKNDMNGRTIPSPSSEGKANPQVTTQAQKVLDQVRQAILTLSTSAYLVDPKAAPLRDALKRLKPLIDQLIDAVSQDGMHSAGDGLPPLFRFKIPPSEREALLKKLIPFPEGKKESSSSRAFSNASVVDKTGEPAPSFSRRDSLASIENDGRKNPLSDKKASNANIPNASQMQIENAPKEGPKEGQTPFYERTSIPAAPFTPQAQSNTPSRKAKKKRQSFWLRDEDEEEDRPKQ